MPRKHTPPTAEAQFYVQLICTCPSCGEQIDLVELRNNNGDDPISVESQDLDETVECPWCTIPFTVTSVTY